MDGGNSAIVLAGGKSTRLGRDKASEPLLGRPMLQHVLDRLAGVAGEVVLVCARGQRLPEVTFPGGLIAVEDAYPESGPLGGLYTGLAATKGRHALAVACDMPLLRGALAAELFRLAPGYDVVVPVSADYAQPLCAVYSTACLGPIRARLEGGQLKLMSFYEDVRVLRVGPEVWRVFDADGVSFQNLNRDEDLRRAAALLAQG